METPDYSAQALEHLKTQIERDRATNHQQELEIRRLKRELAEFNTFRTSRDMHGGGSSEDRFQLVRGPEDGAVHLVVEDTDNETGLTLCGIGDAWTWTKIDTHFYPPLMREMCRGCCIRIAWAADRRAWYWA